MNFKLIDQVLDIAIASLLYGSEVWLPLAFAFYVATYDGKPDRKISGDCQSATPLVPQTPSQTTTALPLSTPSTESPIATVEKSTVEKPAAKKPAAKKPAAKESVLNKSTLNQSVTPKLALQQGETPNQNRISTTAVPEMICEPVDWKKWKASDLRKASIAKICGVRMTPIGSHRKLSKADLIAQYEQNLKRFTKLPVPSSDHHKTA
ncbi:MAG: hypothetical protein HC800_22715 [Phormidesmis sp. RL_2_1]|nr:hypothetical protein [Phormidesmis sp. RL_2_1]